MSHRKKQLQARDPLQNAESALMDPPDLLRPGYVVISYLESRHPMQSEIFAHRIEQLRLGDKYDPLKDPPVQLDDLAPRLAIKVSAIFDSHDAADDYALKLHAATDWNVVVVRAGVAQVFPPSESVSGKYKEEALEQYISGFYDKQRKGKEAIKQRVEIDRASAARQTNPCIDSLAPALPPPPADQPDTRVRFAGPHISGTLQSAAEGSTADHTPASAHAAPAPAAAPQPAIPASRSRASVKAPCK